MRPSMRSSTSLSASHLRHEVDDAIEHPVQLAAAMWHTRPYIPCFSACAGCLRGRDFRGWATFGASPLRRTSRHARPMTEAPAALRQLL